MDSIIRREEISYKNAGKWIRDRRKAMKMNQAELAKKSGYSRKSVMRYEAGYNIPLTAYEDIANSLGYDLRLQMVRKVGGER